MLKMTLIQLKTSSKSHRPIHIMWQYSGINKVTPNKIYGNADHMWICGQQKYYLGTLIKLSSGFHATLSLSISRRVIYDLKKLTLLSQKQKRLVINIRYLLGRWVAKLVVRLLSPAALWVRIQTFLKNTKMGDISKRVANTFQPAEKIYF